MLVNIAVDLGVLPRASQPQPTETRQKPRRTSSQPTRTRAERRCSVGQMSGIIGHISSPPESTDPIELLSYLPHRRHQYRLHQLGSLLLQLQVGLLHFLSSQISSQFSSDLPLILLAAGLWRPLCPRWAVSAANRRWFWALQPLLRQLQAESSKLGSTQKDALPPSLSFAMLSKRLSPPITEMRPSFSGSTSMIASLRSYSHCFFTQNLCRKRCQ